jgi:hypothetical protein
MTAGSFRGWPGVAGTSCVRVRTKSAVDAPARGQLRGAGLGVPALELAEVAARGVLNTCEPVLDRAGLPVMAVEIEVRAASYAFRPHEKAQHADHLRALLVDGGGVEVVDLDIALGPDGCASGPASSRNWRARSVRTSSMRLTGAERMSAENC